MATTNNKKPTEVKAVVENKNEIEEMKKILEQKDKENEELRAMIKELGNIVKASQMPTQPAVPEKSTFVEDDLVYINNNSVGSQTVTLDRQGKTSLKVFSEEKNRPIEKSYIKQAMQINQVRRLFEYGVLDFCDKQCYKIYGIEKKFDMSEENVINMFSVENLTKTASQLTALFKKADASIVKHELCYKALDLVNRGILPSEETNAINATLNKLFCSGTNANFNALLPNLAIKRGEM